MAVIHRDTDYAIRALVRLTRADEVVSTSSMADQEEVPEHFLRKIMQRLKSAGLVDSIQGPYGGYNLAVEPAGIHLRDIVEAMQGRVVVNACFDDPGICDNVEECSVHHRLESLQEIIESWMEDVTLADMAFDLKNEGSESDEQSEVSRTG